MGQHWMQGLFDKHLEIQPSLMAAVQYWTSAVIIADYTEVRETISEILFRLRSKEISIKN